MICFPNAKINLGLNIIEKRVDGFHNIETVMLPIPLFDVLEFHEAKETTVETFNADSSILTEENSVFKTWKKLKTKFDIPAFKVKLLKNIPIASGLGGGSSDAAFFLKEINYNYKLGMSENEMESFIEDIGSDCPFFIKNKTALAKKKGEALSEIHLDLKGKQLSLVKPNISIATKNAYSLSKPKISELNIAKIVNGEPLSKWKHLLKNDFESAIGTLFPKLESLKQSLYNLGAEYVSLSGSGPTIFAISNHKLKLSNIKLKEDGFIWQCTL